MTSVTSRVSVVCASTQEVPGTHHQLLTVQPTPVNELQLISSAIKRVNSYKILGVHVSDDLTWNTRIDYLFKKANKRLYALGIRKKPIFAADDLVKIFCALIRSVLEYASPVWGCTAGVP